MQEIPTAKRKIEFKESTSAETQESEDYKSTENGTNMLDSNSNETGNDADFVPDREPLKKLKVSPPKSSFQQIPQNYNQMNGSRPPMPQTRPIQMQIPPMYPNMYPPNYSTPQHYQFTPQTKTIIEDVKNEVFEEETYTFPCRWTSNCPQTFDNEQELIDHVNFQHIESLIALPYVCCWSGCKSTHKSFKNNVNIGLSKSELKKHLKTHHPLRTVTIKEVLKLYKEPAVPSKTNEQPGLSGIPLTALLVLRNLVKCAKELFVGSEEDLVILMAVDGRYALFVGQILGELFEVDE